MKKFIKISALFLVLISLNSCYVNRTTVGNGPVGKSNDAVKYSKQKQLYLFWGLMAINQSQPDLPMECGYQIKSSFNVLDGIVSALTVGIFSMRTVKVTVFKDSRCDPVIRKMERKLEKKEMQEGR